MALLEIRGLEKSFDGQKVLKGIDLSLGKGEVLAVIGPSGNGKTTLLRCINFLETPDSGNIFVNGEVVFSADAPLRTESALRKSRRHFGLVFQGFNLFPQYNALENVALAREQELHKVRKLSKKDSKAIAQAEAAELLRQVGLEDRADMYPHQLSGGQQQRVAIARVLALKPDILCFDEPTSALDPELTAEVLKVIKRLADGSTTMIIVTHEMDFAREAASRVIFMDDGRILEQGTPAEIFAHPKNRRTAEFISAAIGN